MVIVPNDPGESKIKSSVGVWKENLERRPECDVSLEKERERKWRKEEGKERVREREWERKREREKDRREKEIKREFNIIKVKEFRLFETRETDLTRIKWN